MGIVLFAGIASAQNTAAVAPDSDSALETSAAATTEAKKPVALPDCNDARLLELTRRQLAAFQAAEGAGNLYDRRAQKLAVKNTAEFEELSVADFVPRDNYRVANRIISYKINRGLSNEDMRLCRGNNPVLKVSFTCCCILKTAVFQPISLTTVPHRQKILCSVLHTDLFVTFYKNILQRNVNKTTIILC